MGKLPKIIKSGPCKRPQVWTLLIFSRKSAGFELQPVAVGCRAPHTIGYLESYFEHQIADNYQLLNPRFNTDRPGNPGFSNLWALFNRGIFPTMTQLPSCDRNSFQFPPNRENGTGRVLIPGINLTGFYVSDYLSNFDTNKDYMGLVIMAIKDGNDWYVDGRRRKSIRARNGEMRNIRPGYIIMKASEDLDFGGRKTSLHETLLEDFFGRSANDLASEGLFVSGIGFSYQTLDTKTGSYFCDFKFRSG